MKGDRSKRVTELLGIVGCCGFFPVKLVGRIGGHPDWNRHMMYYAVNKGYLERMKKTHRQRTIRSLRITDRGMEYLAEHDMESFNQVMVARSRPGSTLPNLDRILRAHALAIGYVMAMNAGALTKPCDKPSLLSKRYGDAIAPDENTTYFYSAWELRSALRELSEVTTPKTSRLLGVIIRGRTTYFLYYTANRRMFWLGNEEYNVTAAIAALLPARGFTCDIHAQVIIGDSFVPAVKISQQGINAVSRYFSVTDEYDGCFYVTNNEAGDKLLGAIVDPEKRLAENRRALAGLIPPKDYVREYDAVTPDGTRAVVLGYQFDLQRLILVDNAPHGFSYSPIVLCYDYQVKAMQKIVGPKMEVQAINEE